MLNEISVKSGFPGLFQRHLAGSKLCSKGRLDVKASHRTSGLSEGVHHGSQPTCSAFDRVRP
jgi:hypothetical protein